MSTVPDRSIEVTHQPTHVILRNGQSLHSHKTCLLPHPSIIPKEARLASAFHGLTEGASLSIGQLCDHGCTATFNANTVDIEHNNKIVMTGCRNRTNGLWCVDLSAQSPPTTLNNKANYIVTKTNAEKITRFLHGACGSPTIETFAKAIEAGFLAT